MNNLVSVIIPVYNEALVIGRLLRSIKKQTYHQVEIIVVDDGSQDRTVEIAREYTKNLFARRHAERSIQRNFGASKAKGEYLLFLDADMELSPKVIKSCFELAKSDRSIGAIVIPEHSVATNFWERVKAFERSFYNKEGDRVTDAARFFSRKAFQEVGGYDERLTGPEDWDLPERVEKQDFKIGRIKVVIYHHERIGNLFLLLKKKYYYALKSSRYLTRHKISLVSPKTIYFLRPVFYKYWKDILTNPLLSLAMFLMLTLELVAGGAGFLIGRVRR